ncbi:hypothetical protein TH63_14765 [Rufibacter radiotolerans]|uniref:Uncharacterized protein n=1 Tax=Rufibacter radiotolerans TaxID=1379910 RepID=A0A0H4VLE2_9BACT|nr:hypothetical protein TH63_14765 [Rufibacter radiotolerans]
MLFGIFNPELLKSGFAIRRGTKNKVATAGDCKSPFRNFRIANPEELNFHSPIPVFTSGASLVALQQIKLRAINKSRPQGQCEGERRGPAAVSARRGKMKHYSIRTQASATTTPATANCMHKGEKFPPLCPFTQNQPLNLLSLFPKNVLFPYRYPIC